jgi:hypothetical protein
MTLASPGFCLKLRILGINGDCFTARPSMTDFYRVFARWKGLSFELVGFYNETEMLTRRTSGHCLSTFRTVKLFDHLNANAKANANINANNNNNNNNNSITVYLRADSTTLRPITEIARPTYDTCKYNFKR